MDVTTLNDRATLTAKDVMTRDVIGVPADMPVEDLAGFLTENGISGAPVLDHDDELIGVVSLTDIVRHDGLSTTRTRPSHRHDVYLRLELEREFDADELDGLHLEGGSGTRVRDIMTPVVFGVVEDMPIQDIADYMIRGKIHRQFVTRDRQVVGVITAMDLLKVVRELPR